MKRLVRPIRKPQQVELAELVQVEQLEPVQPGEERLVRASPLADHQASEVEPPSIEADFARSPVLLYLQPEPLVALAGVGQAERLAASWELLVQEPGLALVASELQLSLIHISEPTRPY